MRWWPTTRRLPPATWRRSLDAERRGPGLRHRPRRHAGDARPGRGSDLRRRLQPAHGDQHGQAGEPARRRPAAGDRRELRTGQRRRSGGDLGLTAARRSPAGTGGGHRSHGGAARPGGAKGLPRVHPRCARGRARSGRGARSRALPRPPARGLAQRLLQQRRRGAGLRRDPSHPATHRLRRDEHAAQGVLPRRAGTRARRGVRHGCRRRCGRDRGPDAARPRDLAAARPGVAVPPRCRSRAGCSGVTR